MRPRPLRLRPELTDRDVERLIAQTGRDVTGLCLRGFGSLSDAAIRSLLRLPDLRLLDLSEMTLAPRGLGWLAALPLTDLILKSTDITDSDLSSLPSLPRLRRLELNKTAVGDRGLELLPPLPRLERLDLFRTRVTDAGVAHLGAATALIDLNLSRSRVTDGCLEHLRPAHRHRHRRRVALGRPALGGPLRGLRELPARRDAYGASGTGRADLGVLQGRTSSWSPRESATWTPRWIPIGGSLRSK